MTNSEKSIETTDIDSWSIYEKDIEEIVVDSCSEDDYEDDIFPDIHTKLLAKGRECERRKTMTSLYHSIQKLLGGGEAEEPQSRILKKATAACKQLCQEELNLKYETEFLLQKNWKLKRRVEKLVRKKKRKTGSATFGRRSSGPLISPSNKTLTIEKRSASVDESQLVVSQNSPAKTPSHFTGREETAKILPPVPKNSKRKLKKRSGLSEEEKEFYEIEEKIEDLLYDIDALWNEVKNDEKEIDEDNKFFDDLKLPDSIPVHHIKSSGPSQGTFMPKRKEKIKVTDINKLMQPELNTIKNKDVKRFTSILKPRITEAQQLKNREMIKITNINKILDPIQNPIITSTHDSPSFINITKEIRRCSTSGDESPRLVIDENPPCQVNEEPSKLTQRELDVMEALQAVDTLCLSLVSDEPTTSESQPVLVDMTKVMKAVEKPDVIAISDSEDETANSDVVCIE